MRLDGSNLLFGNLNQQFGMTNPSDNVLHPKIVQPRVGVSYEVTRNDNVSASFGNSIQNPYFSSMVATVDPRPFAPYSKIPAFDNLTGNSGSAVKFCGINANLPCKSYADQLYWEYQNAVGLPIAAVKPERFANYDFSYAHQFRGNLAMKVTPFYREGTDIVVSSNPTIGTTSSGAPIFGPTTTTNQGKEKTTGVEFQLTKDAEYGLSGQLTATYINEFSNVPPLASAEDVFPSISPASIALGKLYRVGFLSPFVSQLSLQYKTHNGFRINPVIQYTRGYPYNQGSLTAFQLPERSVHQRADYEPDRAERIEPGTLLRGSGQPGFVYEPPPRRVPWSGRVARSRRDPLERALQYRP